MEQNEQIQQTEVKKKKFSLPKNAEEWKIFGKKALKVAIDVTALLLAFAGGAAVEYAISSKKHDTEDLPFLPDGSDTDNFADCLPEEQNENEEGTDSEEE